MSRPFCRVRITKYGFIGSMLFMAVLLNEWLLYVFKAMQWPDINDVQGDNVRVLIAADPQILSTNSEPHFPLSLVTTWDADRFVSRGFHLALWKTKPEVIIFLGDVLDDGSISNDADFHQKAKHFQALMYIPSYVKHIIYVPGDNDIGGEGADKVTDHKVQRFYEEFNQNTTVSYRFIDFTQEHGLFKSQFEWFSETQDGIGKHGVSAMDKNLLKRGRPHDEVAILWHPDIKCKVTSISSESSSVCAVLIEISNENILLMCVCIPCDDGCLDNNIIEYSHVLNNIALLTNSIDAGYNVYWQ